MKRFRLLLALTGLTSAVVAGGAVYLAMSVPNDLRADSLLSQARNDITAGKHDAARGTLMKVIQQYPRTDAAAAATAAIVSMAQKDRDELARAISVIRKTNDQHGTHLSDLQKRIALLEKRPAPVVTVIAPAPKKPAVAKKKPVPKRPTTTRRRRR